MKRRVFNILSAMSLLVAVAVGVLWVWSYSRHDWIQTDPTKPPHLFLDSACGVVNRSYIEVITRLHLYGSNWTPLRELLRRLSQEGYPGWLVSPDSLQIYAIRSDGEVSTVALQTGAAANAVPYQPDPVPAPAETAMLARARQIEGFEQASFRWTRGGGYLLIFPRTQSNPVTGAMMWPDLSFEGQNYKRGAVGLFVERETLRVGNFPLNRQTFPLTEVAEVKGRLQFLYTNLAYSSYSPRASDQTIRVLVTDGDGHSISELRSDIGSKRTLRQAGLMLASWDADHGRLWWWSDLPIQSSVQYRPTFSNHEPWIMIHGWDFLTQRESIIAIPTQFRGEE